jgi:methylated-DNA-[protein]-cysteine S-methyltransferase
MRRLNPFKERVIKAVMRIPPGEVRSYKEVAWMAGNPHAFRAVARVMAMNTDPKVPCHRVIKSDGTLGGFGRGGEARKRELLRREGVLL